MTDFDKSRIEKLKQTLYSRNENIVPKEKRTPVEGHNVDAPTNWGEPKTFEFNPETMARKNNSFFNKFLLWSVIFFVIAVGAAIFSFMGGFNMISSNNLDIKVVSPSSVSSGEELDMGLTILNANRTDLTDVSLEIIYPEGSQSVGDNSKPLTRETEDLGTIKAGGSANYTLRALLFGEKDSIKTFDLRLEYKVKNSNAVFSKEKFYDVSIGSSPLLLNVTYPQEINSGQDVQLSVDVTSNSPVVLSNTLLKVEYPYGFTYKSSNIRPLRNNSVWNIGDLKNGDKKTLVITGTLVGQDQEDRSFRVSVGTPSSPGDSDFSTALSEFLATVGIRKSFFNLELVPANGSSVTAPGQSAGIAIKWQNTLPDKIESSQIQATIFGNGFDHNQVSVGNSGFYRSVDNTVLWDKSQDKDLIEILPGDAGSVSLTPSALNEASIRQVRNPHIDVHVVMSGSRSGTQSGPVQSTADISIKVASTLTLAAKSFRNNGTFSNTGPIPPRADQETTYTVNWLLTNTTNDISNTTVSATLPPGVSWKGQTSPSGEKINYNPDSHVVTWNASNVSAGTGFNYSPRQVSFQVGITPSVNQINTVPPLTSSIQVSGTDSWTNTPVALTLPAVTTQYSDPGSGAAQATVVK